ncbi:hypothetical protein [Candidatus Spongiihabitans sp.]
MAVSLEADLALQQDGVVGEAAAQTPSGAPTQALVWVGVNDT